MKTAKTVSLIALIVSGLMAVYLAYTYFAYTEQERMEQTLEMMESVGVPQDIIDQARADAETQLEE